MEIEPPTMKLFKGVINSLRGEAGFRYIARAREIARAGFKVINFGVGQPDVPTFQHIVDEAKRALDGGFTGYTETSGIPELRAAIAEYLNDRYGSDVKADELIVTPGAKPAIFLAIASYIEPGDEVIVPEPSFPAYPEIVRFLGAKPVYVPLKWLGEDRGFELDLDGIERAVTNRTKMIVINNPHNPTGALFNSKQIDEVYRIAVENKLLILADEIYDNFLYDESRLRSFISFADWRDHLLYVNGFSKTFSMTGWRLGYLVARGEVASKITRLAVNIWSCATSFVQKAGIVALKGSWKPIEDMIRLFEKRRNLAIEKLREIKGVEVWPSKGTFYLFPYMGSILRSIGMSSEQFVEQLVERKHVIVLPGTVFPERAGAEFIRISFALNDGAIAEGIERLKSFIVELTEGKEEKLQASINS
ncbi:MAG: pyridoxal phosphate-dependent aminotransferase [Ignisphaera sp.]|nr:pyridoxal phosphate-dependent aminotransferase [Ignisphaera sp.]MCX8168387.1 pyridoxal phosphate-dependent aminotransferase [Ignisphaera sp.]MDW8085781.1 pyridoxal phosphate-dependent aminotransferase [Ignisphaera sp.]